MEEETWRRKRGGGNMEEETWQEHIEYESRSRKHACMIEGIRLSMNCVVQEHT